MDTVEVLKYAIVTIGILVMTFCGFVWREINQLRKDRHRHGNWLTQVTMATNLVLQKLGMGFEVKGPPDD